MYIYKVLNYVHFYKNGRIIKTMMDTCRHTVIHFGIDVEFPAIFGGSSSSVSTQPDFRF